MKHILYLLLILSFSSCYFLNDGPVNGKYLNKKPSIDEMVGIWEVDKFSYELNEHKGYERKKIELTLKANGSFQISNLPNYINVFDQTEDRFVTTEGKWELEKDFKKEHWVLKMNFSNSNLYNKGMIVWYDLYLLEDELIIWNFIGDPDSGNRFLYRKQ